MWRLLSLKLGIPELEERIERMESKFAPCKLCCMVIEKINPVYVHDNRLPYVKEGRPEFYCDAHKRDYERVEIYWVPRDGKRTGYLLKRYIHFTASRQIVVKQEKTKEFSHV